MSDWTGQQVGNYHVARLLEHGAVIDRYLGYDLSSRRPVTLFLLATPTDEAGILRFQRNLPVITHLMHPHIAPLLATGVQDRTPFVALDQLPTSRQHHSFPLPVSTVIRYVSQLADALDHAHSQHICPGYSAPETILIGQHGEALLAGFAMRLLELSQGPQNLDRRWEHAVPLCYLPPELLVGGPVGPFSDQYALAAVVYEWLCGVPPFDGAPSFQTALQIIQAPPPPLREKAPIIPPALEQVIMKALARKPEERFSTIQAFSQALARAGQQAVEREGD